MNLNRWIAAGSLLIVAFSVIVGCAGKKPRSSASSEPLLPGAVFYGAPARKYQTLGVVRASKSYPTLNQELTDEQEALLCKKAFNDAARELLKNARDNGGDAVADLHSVIYLAEGRRETYDKPECTDDGEEGEVLVQGVAIKWTQPELLRK